MVNSRRKGNEGERQVIKILRKYFPGNWERKSMGIDGPDILTPDYFPFAIEVKNVKKVRFKHLFLPTKELYGFWAQAATQARQLKKQPLLVIKVEGSWLVTQEAITDGVLGKDTWWFFEEWCKREKGREYVS